MFEIEVPEGAVPGSMLSVDLPGDRSVKVAVPPGAVVGQLIAFNLKGAPKPLSKEEQAACKLQASIRGKVARAKHPEAAAVARKSIVFTKALDAPSCDFSALPRRLDLDNDAGVLTSSVSLPTNPTPAKDPSTPGLLSKFSTSMSQLFGGGSTPDFSRG